MAIKVTCEACFSDFNAGDQHAGKRVKCPACGEPVRIPSGGEHTAAPRSVRSSPRRRQSSKSNANQPIIYACLGGGGVVLLLAVGFIAFQMGRSGTAPAAVVPQAIATDPAPSAPAVPVTTAVAPVTAPPAPTATPTATIGQSADAKEGTPAQSPIAETNLAKTAAPETRTDAAAATVKQPRDRADLIEELEKSVVRIEVKTADGGGTGSGFVLDQEGTIATNYHVVTGAVSATVVFSDKSTSPVIGYVKLVPEKDIALLKIGRAPQRLFPVTLAGTLPRKGESVLAFGAPLGLSFSASDGIVSSVRSDTELLEVGAKVKGTWIQTTTPISPGNSGGPLVNLNGEVLGANTMSLVEGQNLNFAISATDIRDALQTKQTQVISLRAAATPKYEKEAPATVDESKTERGRRLLADVKEVFLLSAEFTFDPTGRAYQMVQSELTESLDKLGIRLVSKPGPKTALLILAMAFGDKGKGTAGTQSLVMSASLLLPARDEQTKQRQLVTIWSDFEDVGSFSIQSLARGVIPRTVQTKVTKFFTDFRNDYRKAVAEFGPKKESDGDAKEAPKTDSKKK